MWLRQVKYFLLKFLRLKDSPRAAALGFALGAITNFLPVLGFGVILAVLLAGLFRANILASIIGHYVFAVLFPVCMYLNVRLGQLILREDIQDLSDALRSLARLDFHSLAPLTKTFIIGAGINIILVGVILFIVILRILKSHRKGLIAWLASKKPLKIKPLRKKKNKKIK